MRLPSLLQSVLPALLNGALVAFFTLGGAMNLFPPETIRRDYARWGYPQGFHMITGGLELLAAALMAVPRSRSLGRGCAALVMLGALTTLLFHAEYSHAVAPALVLLLLAASHVLDNRARAAGRAV